MGPCREIVPTQSRKIEGAFCYNKIIMRKNEFDVPVDWGKLSSHKPSLHAKSDKQIYWAKIRMAMKKKKFKEKSNANDN